MTLHNDTHILRFMKQKRTSLDPITKVDLQFSLNLLKDEFIDEVRKFRSEIFTRLDDVSKQLEQIREDNTIGNYQTENFVARLTTMKKELQSLKRHQ